MHFIPAWGMTLGNRQRTYHHSNWTGCFLGLRGKYEREYGERYSAGSPNSRRLEPAFSELASKYGLERAVSPFAEQLTLF